MPGTQGLAPEDHADYRFFRFLALHSTRFVVAGLFFILFALIASPNRWEIGIFLGMTVAWLVLVSLVSSMVAYRLYKKRGGVVQKGPRSRRDLLPDAPGQHEGHDDVARDEHQG